MVLPYFIAENKADKTSLRAPRSKKQASFQNFSIYPKKTRWKMDRGPSPGSSSHVWANLPREDSDAEEDRLTLKARSESLSSELLLCDVLGDVGGGLHWSVPL